ncbi:uncharacterized protein BXZ73DRAFT_99432 [Epithele typhae]|uniref:uncharacterized protein n=1 Tax=Epithele typhae TaxID=378194 RepID=UPI002008E658|nr:uncharacterized protein BXZ73DRAFT_99432 [Epithele typhae]KAH9939227.1 hypothetical protein BXZ73DRAFT_99432 [Epithele typhae]
MVLAARGSVEANRDATEDLHRSPDSKGSRGGIHGQTTAIIAAVLAVVVLLAAAGMAWYFLRARKREVRPPTREGSKQTYIYASLQEKVDLMDQIEELPRFALAPSPVPSPAPVPRPTAATPPPPGLASSAHDVDEERYLQSRSPSLASNPSRRTSQESQSPALPAAPAILRRHNRDHSLPEGPCVAGPSRTPSPPAVREYVMRYNARRSQSPTGVVGTVVEARIRWVGVGAGAGAGAGRSLSGDEEGGEGDEEPLLEERERTQARLEGRPEQKRASSEPRLTPPPSAKVAVEAGPSRSRSFAGRRATAPMSFLSLSSSEDSGESDPVVSQSPEPTATPEPAPKPEPETQAQFLSPPPAQPKPRPQRQPLGPVASQVAKMEERAGVASKPAKFYEDSGMRFKNGVPVSPAPAGRRNPNPHSRNSSLRPLPTPPTEATENVKPVVSAPGASLKRKGARRESAKDEEDGVKGVGYGGGLMTMGYKTRERRVSLAVSTISQVPPRYTAE